MDLVLLALVGVSLATAITFGVVAWRALDDQRRRSAARVAALAAAVGSDDMPPGEGDARTISVVACGGGEDAAAVDERRRQSTEPAPVPVASLFTTKEGGAVSGRPLLRLAVVGSMAVALVVVVAMANRTHEPPAAEEGERAALELLSTRHIRDGGTLEVAGLVRNPPAAASVTQITAVVLAFDGSGTLVGSATAPLDFATLAPGDESPFSVTVADATEAVRYRVSFRTATGVLRHLDRRPFQVARSLGASATN